MKWEKLLCEKRQCKPSTSTETDMRNEFQRDYHRIIGSASFRRLQDKTQVFPLDKSDFVRTRLTHSLEVASFAKSLGQSSFNYILKNKEKYSSEYIPTKEDVEKIGSILECAGLIHDIGNPPFGHFGETSIRIWFENNLPKLKVDGISVEKILNKQMLNDLCNFEGNAQALRLLTKLHFLIDEKGMHLTYALLNTIIKYPVNSCEINDKSGNVKDKKMGYYYAEEELPAAAQLLYPPPLLSGSALLLPVSRAQPAQKFPAFEDATQWPFQHVAAPHQHAQISTASLHIPGYNRH